MSRTVCVLLLIFIALGCDKPDLPPATLAALEGAEGYEVLSLYPYVHPDETPAPDNFHGYRVLGRTSVNDPATRAKLNEALRQGVRENDGMVAACFNPRHGIRVTHDEKVHDLVICFECLAVQVFASDQPAGAFNVTPSPQPTFDEVLTAAGVPLAK